MPKPSKTVKFPGTVAAQMDDAEPEASVVVSLSISEVNWRRLNTMRKAKGQKKEQDLVRVFISEGLERAGY
jgi:hypothetical protein